MNNEARKTRQEESIGYPDGEIVKFSSDVESFFDEYLNDLADISNLDDSARLQFPEQMRSSNT